MKKKISIIVLSVVVGVISIIGIISAKANDSNISVSINCPSTATAGSQISCTINSSSNISLAGVFAKYSFSTGVLFNSFTTSNGFTNPGGDTNSAGFTIMNTGGFSGNATLGTLKVTLPSNATSNQVYKIGLTSINPSDVNYNDYFLQDVSSDVRIISNNDKLSSLSITGGSISFNSDTLIYNTTINNSSATISATAADSNAVVTGTGNVSLNYGNNSFNINVKSEAGTTRTYTINVNRPDNRSTNNNLSSLSIDIGNISFNKNTTSYKLTTKSSSVNISASKEDSRASITGDIGSKGLNIGTNTFRINVVAENGSTKTYTITIVRESDQKQDTTPGNKNSNNNLSSLFVTNTNIVFDKNTTVYNLTTTASSTYISASRETTTATITGDTGKHDLKVGKNQFIIRVIAENGSKKTYTINITREESKSNNNYLKSLTLSNGSINFKKTTTEYNIDVSKDIDKITIGATLEDSKSSFENGFGPREVNLSLGNNTMYIKVKSESGQVKTYTLNINRDDGRDSDSSLKNIKLSSGKLKFNKDTLEYKVTVEYNIDKMQIEATPNSKKAKVTINGNDNLSVGDNVFKINVEAENGKVTIYSINVVRKEQGEKISNNNSIKSITIKNHSIDFKSNVYKYTVKANEKELDLTITLDDENATYKIFGNENLKNGSEIKIKVTAENGEEKTYTLVIKKSNLGLIIGIICIIALISSGIGTWLFFKNKKKPSTETYEASDFNQTTTQELPKSLYDVQPGTQSNINNDVNNQN